MMDPPWVFVLLHYFEKILLLVGNLSRALQDEVYIIGCCAAAGL